MGETPLAYSIERTEVRLCSRSAAGFPPTRFLSIAIFLSICYIISANARYRIDYLHDQICEFISYFRIYLLKRERVFMPEKQRA